MRQKTALVVDDDESMLEFCCAALGLEGFDVMPASTGAQALARLSLIKFDVVVTDHVSAGPEGRTVLQAARSLQPQAPVIAMSGRAAFEREVLAYLGGASAFLAKPFTLDQLKAALACCR